MDSLRRNHGQPRRFFFALRRARLPIAIAGLVALVSVADALAEEGAAKEASPAKLTSPGRSLLTADEWKRLDRAVDRGLEFISRNQAPNGSFPTTSDGQPGVTSLCVMAFLARGHQPGKGPYGAQISRAVDYVLAIQDPDVGSLFPERFIGGRPPRSFSGNYNHGIAGVMLAEVYGMTQANQHERIREAINKALEYSRSQQIRPKRNSDEQGGWRYVHVFGVNDADISVTAWQLMFLRAARNAEFQVPQSWVNEAMGYVRRSFDVNERGFVYALSADERYCSRAMVGAGIVCLELGGEHQSETSREAGNWILRHSFTPYNNSWHPEDRYHYSAFYCTQAMFQLGGEYWSQFFPKFLRVLTDAQRADGSWDRESVGDAKYGNVYTTALSVLSLATPYQILPIYQR